MKKYKVVYGETIHDAVSHLKDDDVIYIAEPLRMGSPIKEFTSVDAVYKFQQTPASVGYHIFTVPKSEYKSLKKMRNAEFAFNRLHQERKTKSFDSVLKDEEDIIYEVATSKNGGRMDHEYFESKEELLKKYRGKDNGSVVKLDGFLGPFNNGRKNGKRVYRYEDKSTYYSNDAKPQEVLTKRERLKFITELTKALASPQYGYSWDEANDIAIKHADNLGEDWRARREGDILAEVRQHLRYIKKKMDDSKVVDRQRQLLVGKNYSKYMIDRVFEQAKKYNLDVFVPEVYVDGEEEDLIEWLKSLNVSENGVDRIMRSGSL